MRARAACRGEGPVSLSGSTPRSGSRYGGNTCRCTPIKTLRIVVHLSSTLHAQDRIFWREQNPRFSVCHWARLQAKCQSGIAPADPPHEHAEHRLAECSALLGSVAPYPSSLHFIYRVAFQAPGGSGRNKYRGLRKAMIPAGYPDNLNSTFVQAVRTRIRSGEEGSMRRGWLALIWARR